MEQSHTRRELISDIVRCTSVYLFVYTSYSKANIYLQRYYGILITCILIKDLELSHDNWVNLNFLDDSYELILYRISGSHLSTYAYIVLVRVLPPELRYCWH